MKEFEDAILETSQRIFDAEHKRYEIIENKAIAIITIVGILTTGFIGLVPIDNNGIIFPTILCLFATSALFSIFVLIPRGGEMLNFNTLVDKYDGENNGIQLTGIAATVWKTSQSMRKVCTEKAWLLFISILFLTIGIISSIVLYLMKIFLI